MRKHINLEEIFSKINLLLPQTQILRALVPNNDKFGIGNLDKLKEATHAWDKITQLEQQLHESLTKEY